MQLNYEDFVFLDKTKILGSGSYSRVYLVFYKKNKLTYALKEVV